MRSQIEGTTGKRIRRKAHYYNYLLNFECTTDRTTRCFISHLWADIKTILTGCKHQILFRMDLKSPSECSFVSTYHHIIILRLKCQQFVIKNIRRQRRIVISRGISRYIKITPYLFYVRVIRLGIFSYRRSNVLTDIF